MAPVAHPPLDSVDLQRLHEAAVDALSGVTMTPSVSRHRLQAMVSSRTEWCISRQRSWGVPIPVLYDTESYVAVAVVMACVCAREWCVQACRLPHVLTPLPPVLRWQQRRGPDDG